MTFLEELMNILNRRRSCKEDRYNFEKVDDFFKVKT